MFLSLIFRHGLPCRISILWVVSLAWLGSETVLLAQNRQGPDLPPGVQRPQTLPGAGSLPPNVFIDSIDVDWTEPGLRARLLVSPQSDAAGTTWRDVAADYPDALLIPLSVPKAEGEGLTLPAYEENVEKRAHRSGPATVEHWIPRPAPAGEGSNRVHIGGIVPWTYSGPGAQGQPGWNVALAGEKSVAVAWLGTADEWVVRPPDIRFADRLLISTLNPLSGQGSFFLVRNRSGRLLPAAQLTDWVRGAVPGQHLVAIHAAGPEVAIGLGTWRMGDLGGEGERARIGAILLLESLANGELTDLAREGDSQLSASSYEFAYPPTQTVSGRLWPVALRPPVWMARKRDERTREPDWIDLDLGRTRKVDEIRLIHVGAAGWSPEFNPDELQVELRSGREIEPIHQFAVRPESSLTVLRFADPLSLSGFRLRFIAPGGSGPPARASLMAVQVMGRARD